MKDYSQHGEQAVILRELGYDPDNPQPVAGESRRFLEIGGFDPFSMSNVRALYELGWSGVIVEPSPGPMHGLLMEYGNDPRITLVQAAVSPGNRLVKMAVTDDAITTSHHWVREKFEPIVKYLGTMYVPTVDLEQLSGRAPYDFVSIDTEGDTVDIWGEMSRHGHMWVPLVCVEFEGKLDECDQAKGYERVWANDCNAIYRRKQ